ncbi:MAG: TIGR00645 family protein [Comamonadaceae bacterium]|nr:MAG: TIGR00645 family protein [Comamonadaceae bacterium]
MAKDPGITPISPLRPLPNLIFASRWLQLPLYLGLIAAQAVYVVHFLLELLHLIEAAAGSQAALQQLISSIGYKSTVPVTALNETIIMLVVLALIDVVMISNLLIMVLKVKLATAIIGISSIHLLKTFINADNYSDRVLIAQTAIHITFLLSAIAIAYTDKLMTQAAAAAKH